MSGAAVPDMPPLPAGQSPTTDVAHLTAPTEFERNHSASLVMEFRRLATMMEWEKDSKPYKENWRKRMKEWATQDFGEYFGRNAKDLNAWGKLCDHLGLTTRCNSVTEYKALLKPVYVNLVDLVDSCKTQTRPPLFDTETKLVEYIVETGKIYPYDAALSNPFLTAFLVEVKKNGKMPKKTGKKSRGARRRRMLQREGRKEGDGSAANEGEKGNLNGTAVQGAGKRKRRRSGWRWRKAKAAKAAKAAQEAQAQTTVPTPPITGQ